MAQLLVVTPDASAPVSISGLALLEHTLRACPSGPEALTAAARADVVVVDARGDLAVARSTCRLFAAAGNTVPLLVINCSTSRRSWSLTL